MTHNARPTPNPVPEQQRQASRPRRQMIENINQRERCDVQFDWARGLDDEQWAQTLVAAVDRGFPVPPMPPEALQRMFVGSSGIEAFKEPSIFLRETRKNAEACGAPLTPRSRILDFGVGWGRIYRWLLRDFQPDTVVGVDVDPETIKLCSRDMPFGVFQLIPPLPPYSFRNNEFDLVLLYSVFSHLSEASFTGIIREFERIVKPGGFVSFTTLLERHLDVWAGDDGTRRECLKQVGFDAVAWRQKAQDGDFLFVPTGGGDPSRPASFYGETIITEAYLKRHLPETNFELTFFSEDTGLPQTLVVLRKK